MRRILLISLVLACATSSAQVFKRVGPDGQVYFSDRPGPDAEQIEVAPVQTISRPPVPARTGGPGADASNGQENATTLYSEFAIVSPNSGEGVRANDGNIEVRLSLRPKLRPGHTVVLNLDGEDGEQIKSGDSMIIRLTNLSRGRHSVAARVIGEKDKTLMQAGPISFDVLRVAAGGG